MTFSQQIKEKAYDLGFDLIGIAPANRAPHVTAYQEWLSRNYQAGMQWLARDPERRSDPRLVVPGARSVVVVGLSYFVQNPPAELWNDPTRGRIARYAWGQDYHDVMLPRLRQLGDWIAQESGSRTHPEFGLASTESGVKSDTEPLPIKQRAYVDTGPVFERAFAAQAGIGFVGKNSLLINPRLGSYFFLGEILLDLELEYDSPALAHGATLSFQPVQPAQPAQPKPPHVPSIAKTATCGGCTRCLTACPTHAFPAPYIVDSNRCISYLTIELKGEIPLFLRPMLDNWIYGCDACQEICPWARRYAQPTRETFLNYDPNWAIPKLTDLLTLDDVGFRTRFKGTPIKRTKRRGLLRNVAVAMGNSGDPAMIPILERALADPEPLIQTHAKWAIARIHELVVLHK